jgi:hypothetical protein
MSITGVFISGGMPPIAFDKQKTIYGYNPMYPMAKRCNETFKKNLHTSQQIETNFSHTLQQLGYNTTTTQDKGSFKGYDVTASIPNCSGCTLQYDIKHDQLAHTTGRIAVELWKELNGKRYPSGLTATQADFFVYSFPEDDAHFYLIHTRILKNLIKAKQHIRTVMGGNGGWFKIALFEKDWFLSRCMILKKM